MTLHPAFTESNSSIGETLQILLQAIDLFFVEVLLVWRGSGRAGAKESPATIACIWTLIAITGREALPLFFSNRGEEEDLSIFLSDARKSFYFVFFFHAA